MEEGVLLRTLYSYAIALPLWGGARGGGPEYLPRWRHLQTTARPPPPTPPHKGEGSSPCSPLHYSQICFSRFLPSPAGTYPRCGSTPANGAGRNNARLPRR